MEAKYQNVPIKKKMSPVWEIFSAKLTLYCIAMIWSSSDYPLTQKFSDIFYIGSTLEFFGFLRSGQAVSRSSTFFLNTSISSIFFFRALISSFNILIVTLLVILWVWVSQILLLQLQLTIMWYSSTPYYYDLIFEPSLSLELPFLPTTLNFWNQQKKMN